MVLERIKVFLDYFSFLELISCINIKNKYMDNTYVDYKATERQRELEEAKKETLELGSLHDDQTRRLEQMPMEQRDTITTDLRFNTLAELEKLQSFLNIMLNNSGITLSGFRVFNKALEVFGVKNITDLDKQIIELKKDLGIVDEA